MESSLIQPKVKESTHPLFFLNQDLDINIPHRFPVVTKVSFFDSPSVVIAIEAVTIGTKM